MSEFREALQRMVDAIERDPLQMLERPLFMELQTAKALLARGEPYQQPSVFEARVPPDSKWAGFGQPAAAEKAREQATEQRHLALLLEYCRRCDIDAARNDPRWLPSPPASKVEAEKAREQTKAIDLPGYVKPDNTERVHFYEQEFYVLSNFSAFDLPWKGFKFATSEHAYHWEKFEVENPSQDQLDIQACIVVAKSAHDAFKIAERHKELRRPDWDSVKVDVMRNILRGKVMRHEYVRRKLLQTGDRELAEDSWRDSFWGWGPNRDGQNMLGKLWMEIRAELRVLPSPPAATGEGN